MPYDAEVQGYIDTVLASEASAPDGDIDAMRRAYNTLRAQLAGPWPQGVVARDTLVAGRPARKYTPQAGKGRVLFFHGGGYVLGNLDSHDDFCAGLAAKTECTVTAIDYRLTPEHPHPAAYDDAIATAQSMAADGPFVVVGDSAGGNLAAGVAIMLRNTPAVAGQVLIYPELGGLSLDLPSYTEKAETPMLSTADMGYYRRLRGATAEDVRAAPLLADDVRGIAPCVAFAAAEDPLRDDAVLWASRLQDAGVEAEAVIEPGLPHSYLFARHRSSRAAEAFEGICRAVRRFVT